MRVLVDECLPRQLRHWLLADRPGWAVMTVQDSGWASMWNGALLREADGAFDVPVTADKNMHHQQNFDWSTAKLFEVVPNQGVSYHLFRGTP